MRRPSDRESGYILQPVIEELGDRRLRCMGQFTSTLAMLKSAQFVLNLFLRVAVYGLAKSLPVAVVTGGQPRNPPPVGTLKDRAFNVAPSFLASVRHKLAP